ncbi:hypothetical protein A0H81_11181 [Grifola frondosa]|uniref:Uncharacterized protein n=1 Tax=Grifola frondosa TaxID=5627 RepID=A0A1C7LVM4_GRIFR|nr:hypothetical protein A0H81_11181 [Grifola frondosa]
MTRVSLDLVRLGNRLQYDVHGDAIIALPAEPGVCHQKNRTNISRWDGPTLRGGASRCGWASDERPKVERCLVECVAEGAEHRDASTLPDIGRSDGAVEDVVCDGPYNRVEGRLDVVGVIQASCVDSQWCSHGRSFIPNLVDDAGMSSICEERTGTSEYAVDIGCWLFDTP